MTKTKELSEYATIKIIRLQSKENLQKEVLKQLGCTQNTVLYT